jgi:hypothetical protein
MKPFLGDELVEMPLRAWWDDDPVFVHDEVTFTRKKIVLSVANKDGGVHVDADLEEYYSVLSAGRYAKATNVTKHLTYDGPPPFKREDPVYPDNAHLALVRQLAHEVLRSARHFAWRASS